MVRKIVYFLILFTQPSLGTLFQLTGKSNYITSTVLLISTLSVQNTHLAENEVAIGIHPH